MDIWTIEDLAAINGPLAITGTFNLKRDLDFLDDGSYANPANKATYTTGAGWTPIGTAGVGWFAGTFNGNNHTIRNLRCGAVTNATGINSAGLFGIIDSCTIRDLILINPRVNENATNNPAQAGALIAGIDPEGTVLIERCGTIGGIVRADDHNGGLIGRCHEYASSNVTIRDCFAQTTVSECGTFMDGYGHGGLIGTMDVIQAGGNGIVQRCYSTGQVIAGPNSKGGLIGFDSTGYSISGCYWDTQTSGMSNSVGLGRTTAQMKTLATFSGWTMEHLQSRRNRTWGIQQGRSYPLLRGQRVKIGTAF